ncbi:hypothetical protein EK904_003030 [Melospiza melodia maxima]|nr:hypothetical protein EK904_003030 [Melospiza melodia maxima]
MANVDVKIADDCLFHLSVTRHRVVIPIRLAAAGVQVTQSCGCSQQRASSEGLGEPHADSSPAAAEGLTLPGSSESVSWGTNVTGLLAGWGIWRTLGKAARRPAGNNCWVFATEPERESSGKYGLRTAASLGGSALAC